MTKSRWIWIILGTATLLLRYTMPPAFVENWYSRGLFLGVRQLFDYGITWMPFPLFYLFYALLIIWVVRSILRTKWKPFFTKKRLINWVFGTFALAGGVIFFFFWLWGFNYGRIPLVQQANLQPQPVQFDSLQVELTFATGRLLAIRQQLDVSGEQLLADHFLPDQLELKCRKAVENTLQGLNYPVKGRVRGRILPTKGILMRFSSSGVYWPFVGEGNIDGGLHALQQPFTLCHEIAHGYGITNEGVCNFLAFLATTNSDELALQYAGWLCYWRYVAIAYQRFAPQKYWEFRQQLPVGLQKDLDAINENLEKYPDLFPKARYIAYDAYLKSQGIEDGMLSYSTIIMLVRAWRDKRG